VRVFPSVSARFPIYEPISLCARQRPLRKFLQTNRLCSNQQHVATAEAAVTHLTGFRGNWIIFSEHGIIIGKAGLNLFSNEARLRVAATLALRKVAGFNVRTGTKRNERIAGRMNRQIQRAVCGREAVAPVPFLTGPTARAVFGLPQYPRIHLP
jgi:hypothetical protein